MYVSPEMFLFEYLAPALKRWLEFILLVRGICLTGTLWCQHCMELGPACTSTVLAVGREWSPNHARVSDARHMNTSLATGSRLLANCIPPHRSPYTAHNERAFKWDCAGIACAHTPGSYQIASSNNVTAEDIHSEAAGRLHGHAYQGD